MANDTQHEVTQFLAQLQQFHDALPSSQQMMLDAILDAAEAYDEDNDTVGLSMNPQMMQALNAYHRADLMHEAEQDRLASLASQTPEGEQTSAVARAGRYHRMAGWLTALLAHPARVRPAH